MQHIAPMLGIGVAKTLRKWARAAYFNAGAQGGTTGTESDELRRLRRENADLKRANGILRAAPGFFAAELDRLHA